MQRTSLEHLQSMLRRMVHREQETVTLGAIINGVRIVEVPLASRTANYQVYYCDGGGGVGRAINTCVPARYGITVRIGKPPGCTQLHVLEQIVELVPDDPINEPGTVKHARSHSLHGLKVDGGSFADYVGEDWVAIDPRQLTHLNIFPRAGLTLWVSQSWVWWGTRLKFFTGAATADLTAYLPTVMGHARYVLVELDSDLAVQVQVGPQFLNHPPGKRRSQFVPEPKTDRYPVGVGLLVYGMTAFTMAHIWAGIPQVTVRAAHALQNVVVDDAGDVVTCNGEIVWI